MSSSSLPHAAPCGLSGSCPSIVAIFNHRRTVARVGRIAVSVAVLGLWSALLASFGMGVM